jgi:hypothetical protein
MMGAAGAAGVAAVTVMGVVRTTAAAAMEAGTGTGMAMGMGTATTRNLLRDGLFVALRVTRKGGLRPAWSQA